MKLKHSSKTYRQGVAAERATWIRRLRRDLRRQGKAAAIEVYQTVLLDWGLERKNAK